MLQLQAAHYDHTDSAANISRLTLIQRCRKRAAEEEIPLRQVFDDECRTSDAATLVSFGELESSMYKRRRRALPTLPSNPEASDAAVSASRFATIEDSTFYRGEVTIGEGERALVFATDSQLNLLTSARVIYFDSTFKVVPALYYQLFTVFVPHADHEFPVFFALMTRKTTQLYTAVLRKLGELAPQFIPSQVIADFEEAPAAAVRAVFGDVTVSGCWFHYAQAIIKRLRKIGLTTSYQEDAHTQRIVR